MSSETNLQLFPGVFRSTVGGENPGFFLHSDGRVGIGNKAPTARPTWDTDPNSTEKNKLNVSGHTHIEGNLNVTGSVYGDGSNMTGVTLPWTQSTPNLATDIKYEGGNVGIGGAASTEALTVYGDLNLKSGGQLKFNGQTPVFSNWSVDGSDIYRSTGNVGIGTDDPAGTLHVQTDSRVHITAGTVPAFTGMHTTSSATGRAQLVLSSMYSDLVIASSQINNNHGSTLSFATVNPSNTAEYRKFVINQGNWGSRKDFLDFGLSASAADPNPHSSINSTDTVLTLDGNNKRVGIGTINPIAPLHMNGIIKQTGANWSLTNGGVGLGVDEGAHYDDFAYLNRTLSTPTDVTLTHANQGGKNTRSRITINTAGKYAMYTNGFRQTGTSDTTEIFIYKNGAYQHVRAYSGANGTSNYKTAGSAYTIMDLNANDYVELYLEQATFHGNDSIYFAGHLIA